MSKELKTRMIQLPKPWSCCRCGKPMPLSGEMRQFAKRHENGNIEITHMAHVECAERGETSP